MTEPENNGWEAQAPLRFVRREDRRLLQQLWFQFGDWGLKVAQEWRDVPLVDEDLSGEELGQ